MVKLSVRTTIVLFTVFVGLVSALFFSLVSYQFVRDSALASIEQEYSSSLDALVPLVEDTFHDAERDVLTLSNLPVLKDINGVKINSKNKSAVKLSVDEWHNRLARTFVSLMRNRDFYF